MAKPTYYELLQSPHWQRKRLEVCSRANFACEECGDTETTLNVHHQYYRKGAMPWDYPDECFRCLCEDCHDKRHANLELLKETVASLPDFWLETVIGYAKATWIQAAEDGENRSVHLRDDSEAYGEAFGMSNAYSLYMAGCWGPLTLVIERDENGMIDSKTLDALAKQSRDMELHDARSK